MVTLAERGAGMAPPPDAPRRAAALAGHTAAALAGHTATAPGRAFSPDGRPLATGDDTTVQS